eukprot:scaffold2893_cov254-Pinguiococcus_pyrenoidosus.AAC.19
MCEPVAREDETLQLKLSKCCACCVREPTIRMQCYTSRLRTSPRDRLRNCRFIACAVGAVSSAGTVPYLDIFVMHVVVGKVQEATSWLGAIVAEEQVLGEVEILHSLRKGVFLCVYSCTDLRFARGVGICGLLSRSWSSWRRLRLARLPIVLRVDLRQWMT